MSKESMDSAAREFLKDLKVKEKTLEKDLELVQSDIKRYEKFLGIKVVKPVKLIKSDGASGGGA